MSVSDPFSIRADHGTRYQNTSLELKDVRALKQLRGRLIIAGELEQTSGAVVGMFSAAIDSIEHLGRDTVDLPAAVVVRLGNDPKIFVVFRNSPCAGIFIVVPADCGAGDWLTIGVDDPTADRHRAHHAGRVALGNLIAIARIPVQARVGETVGADFDHELRHFLANERHIAGTVALTREHTFDIIESSSTYSEFRVWNGLASIRGDKGQAQYFGRDWRS